MSNHVCRHCGNALTHSVLDLGHQPPSNAYLTSDQLCLPEITYPLKVYICEKCSLVQLPEHQRADELFTSDYAYFSGTSVSWCDHARRYVEDVSRRFDLNEKSLVIELASNDGYLLQYFVKKGIPCLE